MRTLVTCAELLLLGVGALDFGVLLVLVGALPPAGVPPGLAANDGCGEATRASSSAGSEAVRNLKRL
jgi:hypothetical protein